VTRHPEGTEKREEIKGIPGHSEEAGREICKQLGIDPSKVLSIDIFALHRTATIKTVDGNIACRLVEDRDSKGEMIFHIVREARCPVCGESMELVKKKQISAKYRCPKHGDFIVAFLVRAE